MRRREVKPTHYGAVLDPDTGTPPSFVPADHPDEPVGGKLPPGFGEGRHYRWEPLHDPDGDWVEDEAGRRADVWAEAKAEREAAKRENVQVSVGGRTLSFQADDGSLLELQTQLVAGQSDPDAFVPIDVTTAGNAEVTLDLPALGKVVRAIAAQRRGAHEASQAARARIFDESKPLVRSASAARSEAKR